jgi:hypothetical protein
MKHKNSHLLVGYWSRLRKGREVPDQTEIDPRAIKRMLSHVFILDAASPSRPMYRLAGTALCQHFGFELKGTGFFGHWEAQSGITLASLMRQALKVKQPISLSSIGATSDAGMVEMETVLVPVSFGGGAATRFIGMTQLLGDTTMLAGKPVSFQRLVSSELLREDEPLSTFDGPSQGLPPYPPVQAPVHPRAPHLRLVVNRDHVPAAGAAVAKVKAKLFETFGPNGAA